MISFIIKMSLKIIIQNVSRTTVEGVVEKLELKPGVNILQGPPNSGKTVWLNIIDFLMGDTGPIEEVLANEDSHGKKLYEKYTSASMIVNIGDKELIIERKWNEQGSRGKIYINGATMQAADFSDYILPELQIPILRFPKGNPLSDKAWPTLSWRMMLRHIFRQENFWSDLADKQPEIEQHAVLAQFLGIAGNLFSAQFGDVVAKHKELLKLKAEHEQFGSILDSIGQRMSNPNENATFLTHESIIKAIEALESKIKVLLDKRLEVISREVAKVENENDKVKNYILEKTYEREELIQKITEISKKQKGLISRISEFNTLQSTIKQEIGKLNRTKEAGNLFSDLKITHCPACDQQIRHTEKSDVDKCFLCHQPIHKVQIENRIDFEISQLNGEFDELLELVRSLKNDEKELDIYEDKLRYGLVLVEREIAPLRNRMTALISPEVGHIDAERGRLEEQIESHKRMLKSLDYKANLIRQIDAVNSEILILESQLNSKELEINFEEVSSILEEEMTNYLNQLVKNNRDRWTHDRPRFRIGEKGFTLKVNEGKWSKSIGATSKLYFLFAYHYGLLALSKVEGCNYPGLLIIDFPPELPNTEKNILFTENYVVEPFITLCKESSITMQVIITGNAFINLQGVHQVQMSKTWD